MLAMCMQCLHNSSMSVSITIRHVPDDTRDELAARAALSGRSLQEYLRAQLVSLAGRQDPSTLIAQARERKRRTGSRLPSESILSHRDADRR